MREDDVGAIVINSFAMLVVLGMTYQARSQDATTPYLKMVPVEQFLMEGNAEIQLARSAAPDSISRNATILILGPLGMRQRFREQTVSSAWWDARGEQHSTGTNSGTRR